MATHKHLLTASEAAELAGVSVRVVNEWSYTNWLRPACRRGGRPLYWRGEVLALTLGRCPCCGTEFDKPRASARFCGQACRQAWNRNTDPTEHGDDGKA